MTKHYEQRKAANERYLAKLETLYIRVPQGEKDVIKSYAESKGESVNSFVVRVINEAMHRDQEQE